MTRVQSTTSWCGTSLVRVGLSAFRITQIRLPRISMRAEKNAVPLRNVAQAIRARTTRASERPPEAHSPLADADAERSSIVHLLKIDLEVGTGSSARELRGSRRGVDARARHQPQRRGDLRRVGDGSLRSRRRWGTRPLAANPWRTRFGVRQRSVVLGGNTAGRIPGGVPRACRTARRHPHRQDLVLERQAKRCGGEVARSAPVSPVGSPKKNAASELEPTGAGRGIAANGCRRRANATGRLAGAQGAPPRTTRTRSRAP